MILSCPGADKFKRPEPNYISCPYCSAEVEIWTDEAIVKCPKCKSDVVRENKQQSCLDWCKFAKECLGEQAYMKYLKNKSVDKINQK